MLFARKSQYAADPYRKLSQTMNLRLGEAPNQLRTKQTPKASVVFRTKPVRAVTTASKRSGFMAFLDYSRSPSSYLLRYSRINNSSSSNSFFLIELDSSKLTNSPAAEPWKFRDTRACTEI